MAPLHKTHLTKLEKSKTHFWFLLFLRLLQKRKGERDSGCLGVGGEMALMGETVTEIVIPVAAVIGIGFALLQWYLVSKVRVSNSGENNGYNEKLLEDEEESVDAHQVVTKCAEIQSAISVGVRLEKVLMDMDIANLYGVLIFRSLSKTCFYPKRNLWISYFIYSRYN
ncbi:hypothetical protein ACLOJK_026445 [Asimina triloba]